MLAPLNTIIRALDPTNTSDDEKLRRTRGAYRRQLAKHDQDPNAMEKSYLMRSGAGAFSDAVKSKFGTVWTDQAVVELTIDEALKHFKGDLNTAEFCDPACGDGNFLVTLYQRLIEASQIENPLERSLSVLRRIYGVDIIDRMAAAARTRLVLEHVKYLISLDAFNHLDQVNAAVNVVTTNVLHGNTLRSEGDTWELSQYEGGLCPHWFRTKKFDIIVGNPPYTQYKTRERNLPVPVQYSSQSLALSFWDWSQQHATGVYALNLNDGVLQNESQVRKQHSRHLASIVYDDLTKRYSMWSGGNLHTIVVVGSPAVQDTIQYNHVAMNPAIAKRIQTGRLLTQLDSNHTSDWVPTTDYCEPQTLRNGQSFYVASAGRGGATGTPWMSTLGDQTEGQYIVLPRDITASGDLVAPFKLTSNPAFAEGYSIGNGRSEVKVIKPARHAKAVWCFLNSTLHLRTTLQQWAKTSTSIGSKCNKYQLNDVDFRHATCPDFDTLKTTKPAEYQAVLDFAEAHIQSNNVKSYCAGVDKVINDLLV